MEYEQRFISLFSPNEPLAKMLIVLKKQGGKLHLIVRGCFHGLLFVFNKTYIRIKVDGRDCDFLLGSNFNLDDSYLFNFMSQNEYYVGRQGEIENENLILEKFSQRYEAEQIKRLLIKQNDNNLNFITDNMVEKMFGQKNIDFFNQSQESLNFIFSNYKRASSLESIFPSSKFVEVDVDGEKSFVGIIYKNRIPELIAIGFCSGRELFDERFQVFKVGEKENFYLVFRRAADGERVAFANNGEKYS